MGDLRIFFVEDEMLYRVYSLDMQTYYGEFYSWIDLNCFLRYFNEHKKIVVC